MRDLEGNDDHMVRGTRGLSMTGMQSSSRRWTKAIQKITNFLGLSQILST